MTYKCIHESMHAHTYQLTIGALQLPTFLMQYQMTSSARFPFRTTDEVPLSQSTKLDLTWSPDIQPFEDPKSYKVDIAAYILDPKDGKLEMGKMLASDLPNTGKATVPFGWSATPRSHRGGTNICSSGCGKDTG